MVETHPDPPNALSDGPQSLYPDQFAEMMDQVRQIAKVVGPTRREVLVTTAMVFLMAVLFAIFFFGVDWIIRQALELILTIFSR